MKHIRLILLGLLCLWSVGLFGQDKAIVDFEADLMKPIKVGDSTVLNLLGNVLFYHNGAVIRCDSAIRYSDRMMECFGSVIINKGNTYIYGDRADYDGATNRAQVYAPLVKLVDRDMVLYSYNMDFNTLENRGHYVGGGTLSEKDNLMESLRGVYDANTRTITFVDDVVMRNSDYLLRTDSLDYNLDAEITDLYRKALIWSRDGDFLSAKRGRYYRATDTFVFTDSSYVLTPNQEMWADSITYVKPNMESVLRGNIQIFDRAHDSYGFGDFGRYWGGDRDRAFLTQNPSVIGIDTKAEPADSVFMRADTIFIFTVGPGESFPNVVDSLQVEPPDLVGLSPEDSLAAGLKPFLGASSDSTALQGGSVQDSLSAQDSSRLNLRAQKVAEKLAQGLRKELLRVERQLHKKIARREKELVRMQKARAKLQRHGKSKPVSVVPIPPPNIILDSTSIGPLGMHPDSSAMIRSQEVHPDSSAMVRSQEVHPDSSAMVPSLDPNAKIQSLDLEIKKLNELIERMRSKNNPQAETRLPQDSGQLFVGDSGAIVGTDSLLARVGADAKLIPNATALKKATKVATAGIRTDQTVGSTLNAIAGVPGQLSDSVHIQLPDSAHLAWVSPLQQMDTVARDSVERIIRAYSQVKIFRNDFQAVGDSLVAFSVDSTIHLYIEPVLWSDSSQLTSEVMDIYTRNQQLDRAVFNGSPFMCQSINDTVYNQVSGKEMEAFFRNNAVYQLNVDGNAQTYYYLQESDSPALKGFLVAESAKIRFDFEQNKVKNIVYIDDPVYSIYPMHKIPETQPRLLKGFRWESKRRPPNRGAIFNREVRPSKRAINELLPRPEFQITRQIEFLKMQLLREGTWSDRNDTI